MAAIDDDIASDFRQAAYAASVGLPEAAKFFTAWGKGWQFVKDLENPPPPPPPPPLTGFPTPGDTALGTTGWRHTGALLVPYTGPTTIEQDGTVIDAKNVPTRLTIAADNVTIKRSLLHAPPDGSAIYKNHGVTGLLLEDVEVTSQSSTPSQHGDWAVWLTEGGGASATNSVLRRVYIHGTASGVTASGNFTVEDSWIGANVNLGTQHTCAIGAFGGDHHCIVRNNYLESLPGTHATSALEFANTFGTSSDIWIVENLMNTGGGYTLYTNTGSDDPYPRNFGVHVLRNHFGVKFNTEGGMYGINAGWANGPTNEWDDNRWWAPGLAKHLTPAGP